jgi:hypothetical protein
MCLPSKDSCSEQVRGQITTTLKLALAIAAAAATDGADLSLVFKEALKEL